ncbi:MAG: HupE/UreJ family protein [Rhizobiaceae bacterium]
MRILRWCIGPFLVFGTSPAHAHSPFPGIEGFYVGLIHPFSTPSQALLMFGLGLLIGGFETQKVRWLLAAFVAATFAGILMGPGSIEFETAMFAIAFVACAWAALVPGKLLPIAVVLPAIGGVLIGMASVPDPGPAIDRLVTMFGSIVGANIGLVYIWAIIYIVKERYSWAWVDIGFRVLAAWLGAISLVMLALGFATNNAA